MSDPAAIVTRFITQFLGSADLVAAGQGEAQKG